MSLKTVLLVALAAIGAGLAALSKEQPTYQWIGFATAVVAAVSAGLVTPPAAQKRIAELQAQRDSVIGQLGKKDS
jgi:membrane protein implicated in regulation of membrane protease activity